MADAAPGARAVTPPSATNPIRKVLSFIRYLLRIFTPVKTPKEWGKFQYFSNLVADRAVA